MVPIGLGRRSDSRWDSDEIPGGTPMGLRWDLPGTTRNRPGTTRNQPDSHTNPIRILAPFWIVRGSEIGSTWEPKKDPKNGATMSRTEGPKVFNRCQFHALFVQRCVTVVNNCVIVVRIKQRESYCHQIHASIVEKCVTVVRFTHRWSKLV